MSKTKQLVFCSLFTALIAVGAFIKIPVPVVPFTLQYLFTMLAGLILGPRLGTISVTAYMLLGLAGLPIFTEGGGLWYVLKPSFGYIIGFCIGTYVTGTLAARLKKRTVGFHISVLLTHEDADGEDADHAQDNSNIVNQCKHFLLLLFRCGVICRLSARF